MPGESGEREFMAGSNDRREACALHISLMCKGRCHHPAAYPTADNALASPNRGNINTSRHLPLGPDSIIAVLNSLHSRVSNRNRSYYPSAGSHRARSAPPSLPLWPSPSHSLVPSCFFRAASQPWTFDSGLVATQTFVPRCIKQDCARWSSRM